MSTVCIRPCMPRSVSVRVYAFVHVSACICILVPLGRGASPWRWKLVGRFRNPRVLTIVKGMRFTPSSGVLFPPGGKRH